MSIGPLADDAALLARIQAVDPVHAETMGRAPTIFTVEPLPFYRNVKLVRAEVDLPHRPLAFRYADAISQLVYLSGGPSDVYYVNELDGLALAEAQVAPYLRFFLSATRDLKGRQREPAERPGDLAWLPASESDAPLRATRAKATALLRPLAVSAAPGGHRVVATVVEGRRLVELALRVDAKGRVAVDRSQVLFEDLPVAEAL